MLVAGRIRFLLPGSGRATVPPPAKHQQWALLLSLSEALLMLQDSSTVLLCPETALLLRGLCG